MTIDQIITLIQHPAGRVMLTAWLIGACVRLLKDDTILPTLPTQYRRLVAFGLGLLAGVVDAVIAGASWQSAAIAVAAPPLAIAGHHVLVDWLRGGREGWLPSFLKAIDKPPPSSRTHITIREMDQ
jgi:hypothetical protein